MNLDHINRYQEFRPWYEKIVADFGFDRKMDGKARDVLYNIYLKRNKNWKIQNLLLKFRSHIQRLPNILIYGCGPSLASTIEKMIDVEKKTHFIAHSHHFAADGASVLLKKRKIPIQGLFTDLDGINHEEFQYADFVIVHAHGDNIDKLKAFQNDIINKENVLGTTQVKPKNPILNPGGFTDGDRILYFLRPLLLPTQRIFMIGMDFKQKVGKYSKPYLEEDVKASPSKRKKLNYAVRIIDNIIEKINNKIFFVNSVPINEMKNFKYISLDEFKEKLSL